MLSVAYPALDFHVLELLLGIVLLVLFLFVILLPCDAWPEDYVLSDRGCVKGWARRMALLIPEFGPRSAFCNTRIDCLLYDSRAYAASGLHPLAFIVESV